MVLNYQTAISAFAAAVAIASLFTARRSLSISKATEERQRWNEARAQSSKVYLEIIHESLDFPYDPKAPDGFEVLRAEGGQVSFRQLFIRMTNGSDRVLFLTEVRVSWLGGKKACPIQLPIGTGISSKYPLRTQRNWASFELEKPVVAPKSAYCMRIPLQKDARIDRTQFALGFRDDDGRGWWRRLDGLLVRGTDHRKLPPPF